MKCVTGCTATHTHVTESHTPQMVRTETALEGAL